MQMIVWPDLEAPEDARYKIIMSDKTRLLTRHELNLMQVIDSGNWWIWFKRWRSCR